MRRRLVGVGSANVEDERLGDPKDLYASERMIRGTLKGFVMVEEMMGAVKIFVGEPKLPAMRSTFSLESIRRTLATCMDPVYRSFYDNK